MSSHMQIVLRQFSKLLGSIYIFIAKSLTSETRYP